MSKNFVNMHKHSWYSNSITPDSPVAPQDYVSRILELGQTVLSGVEHGSPYAQNVYYDLAKDNNLKFLFGVEAYMVKDRLAEVDGKRDSTNGHILLLAKNDEGRRAINRVISQANIDGFYYKPRIDWDLFMSLPGNSVWVTTACLGGFFWKYENTDDLILQAKEHFGQNFFLEVQNHLVQEQADLNKQIIDLSNRHNIPIIFGLDSHFIYPKHAEDRNDFLLSRGISYPEEDNWFMDFPDYNEAKLRFFRQNALTTRQIEEAMENTLVFEDVEEYTSEVYQNNVKLPTLYPDKTQEERNQIFVDLINEKWNETKENIPPFDWDLYEEEIKKEVSTVVDTNMSDYFLIDYEIIKRGVKDGGHMTLTGRGSGVSYIISKLLGLTTVDRVSAEVKLFPERFITKERILQAGTLPDFDFNLGNPEVFAQAQKDVLGEDNSYPMIAYGTAKPKAAWKLYARSQGIEFDVANVVSGEIERYEMAIKHAEDEQEREQIDILDYVSPEYRSVFIESEKYQGIINDIRPHPCGCLIYNKPISEEIGLIRCKDSLCVNMDGAWAEKNKFVKNDLLKASVVELIHRVYKRVGIKPHQLPDLIELCEGDKKVWEVYKNAWVMGVNQIEGDGARGLISDYAPQNIAEVSAFVAAIRPGFKTHYKQFQSREPFEFGIESIDKLLQTPDFPYSYMLYQENAMKIMQYAGIPISETYEVIKNIAKKRAEKVYEYKDIFLTGMKTKLMEIDKIDEARADEVSIDMWQVIEDSSRYSFNACFSGDTKIQKAGSRGRFQPTIEEMYKIKNDREYAIKTGHYPLYKKYNASGYGNALSMFDDKRIHKNKIVDIRYQGKRQTYKIITESGAYAICTDNHKFPTTNGDKRLDELKVGDSLYVKGVYEKHTDNYRFTDGNFAPNFPKQGEQGFQEIKDGASRIFKDFSEDCKNNGRSCEICNKLYDGKKRFEVHHKDFNRLNKDVENLQWLCVSCHKKEHYRNGERNKVFDKGIPTLIEKIITIESHKVEEVYDIEMADPAHNVITDSGLVASNSHAYSVAGDSLYGAYLKSHYPLEFYETLLNICEDDGDKDRLVATKEEARKAYHINFPPYRFGQDNRTIVMDKENWAITSSLKSIKGFSSKAGDDMWALSQQNFDNFLDLLVYAEENRLLYSYVEKLISINYFEKFGGNMKLLKLYKAFTEGKIKYLRTYVGATKEKRLQALKEYAETLENIMIPILSQVESELEILGYIQSQYNIPKKYLFVQGLDLQYSPRINVYCLASGKVNSLKIRKNIYNQTPFSSGEIIEVNMTRDRNGNLIHLYKEPRRKFINGKFVDVDNEYDWWLNNYRVVSPQYFDKVIAQSLDRQ